MTGLIAVFAVYSISWFLLYETRNRNGRHQKYTRASAPPKISPVDQVFAGIDFPVSFESIQEILLRRHPYYQKLDTDLQLEFAQRVRNFIRRKTFIIKDDQAFYEMPVLVSAAAIQLTFGLQSYLLPFYKFIRIHPTEYLGEHGLKILAGNVANNTITVAWNHFLQGYAQPSDGSNLGLHEMSHALYFQKLMIDGNYSRKFCEGFNQLISECHEASRLEKAGIVNLYSPYADTDIQEFWAESVELFFERPEALQNDYPAVYYALKQLLNQDPLHSSRPFRNRNRSLSQRMRSLIYP